MGGVHANIGQGEVGLKGGVDIHNVGERGMGGVGKGGSNTPLALVGEVGGPGERAKDVRWGVKGKEKLSDKTLGPKGAARGNTSAKGKGRAEELGKAEPPCQP